MTNKAIITRDKLNKALKDVGHVVNNTIDTILENVMIEVKKDHINFKTSNLNTTITTRIEQKNDIEFIMCVGYAKLKAISSQLNTVDVEIIWDNELRSAQIVSGKAKAKIAGESPADWPMVKEISEESSKFSINSHKLIDVINQCFHRVSDDDLRPAMTGLNIFISGGKSEARSTDGHGAVVVRMEDVESDNEISTVVNREFRIAKDLFVSDQPLTLKVDTERYVIIGDRTTIEGRNIEERFPDIDNVMPEIVEDFAMRVDKSLLLKELSRAALFTEKDRKIILNISTGKLVIESKNISFGEDYTGELEMDYTGEEVQIGMDYTLMRDCIFNSPSDDFRMYHCGSEKKAMIIKDEDYTALMMPMI